MGKEEKWCEGIGDARALRTDLRSLPAASLVADMGAIG